MIIHFVVSVLKMLKSRIRRKPEFITWVDPRIPDWWLDPKVWEYLGKNYGLEPGGIIDDDENKPPIIFIERRKMHDYPYK